MGGKQHKMSAAGLDALRQKQAEHVAERLSYCAEVLAKSLPAPVDDFIPWKSAVDRAVVFAAKNGLDESVFAAKKSGRAEERLYSYLSNTSRHTPMQHTMETEQGTFLERGRLGIRRANKHGILAEAERTKALVRVFVESHNDSAENARGRAAVERISLRILPALIQAE